MPRPDLSKVPTFYHVYINQVKEDDLIDAFKNQTIFFTSFLKKIPKEKRSFRYAAGKWTIKEVLQHIIDAERIFSDRALRFARKDTTPQPGFDENNYALHAKTELRKWKDVVKEWKAVRQSTSSLFASFDEEQLAATGIASDKPNYVLGLGYTIAGHAHHHINIIKERYLPSKKV